MSDQPLHSWDVSPTEAREIQDRLRARVLRNDAVEISDLHLVGGVDNGYVRRGAETVAVSAVVVAAFPSLDVVEVRHAVGNVRFPYVPGLLSFREAPIVLDALAQLESSPDVLIFDGHGYAHPRRLGLASHLGVWLDRPTIGCAKSRLIGRHDPVGPNAGDRVALVDKGELIGQVVRAAPRRRPVYVSAGHRLTLDTAVEIVLACCPPGSGMPLPTRRAHEIVTAETTRLRQEEADSRFTGLA